MTGSEVLARRLALALGLLMLASVSAELIMAIVDNGLSTPVGRFLAVNSAIARLGQVVWGVALLAGVWWTSGDSGIQKRAGWALLAFGVLLLIPPAYLALNLAAATSGLAPGGMLRARVQFSRSLAAYLTLSLLLLTTGRLLLAAARRLEQTA